MKYTLILLSLFFTCSLSAEDQDQFTKTVKPLLEKYCIDCHGGKKIKGHLNLKSIGNMEQAIKKHQIWEDALELMIEKEMPPEDEKQPSTAEITVIKDWYTKNFINIKAKPAVAKLRRLSAEEYRNSIRTLLGFDLQIHISGTPETVVETSVILKMLPPDPPGESGFGNDTTKAPINETIWEKYGFISNTAIENLFAPENKKYLEVYTGKLGDKWSKNNVLKLITKFTQQAFKSKDCDEAIKKSISRIRSDIKKKISLKDSCKKELKLILLSPQFLYNGHFDSSRKGQQLVSQYEMAQRLSYFLWGTLPDQQLLDLAQQKKLLSKKVLIQQVDRMLDDKRSKVSTELFAREWLALDEMKKSREKWPHVHAKFFQPIHFVDYLIREDRPIMELIDSDVTYVNQHLNKFYDKKDYSKFPRSTKPKGTEVLVLDHQKVQIPNSANRGGILTMPGILTMYSGNKRTSPILRGIWVLERILGDHLGEPPMDVPAIPKPKKGEKLTFRQIFERHQNSPSCSVCHSKIDPLGFGLENYDDKGNFRKSGKGVDSAGKAPNGDKFADFAGLKKILIKKYDEDIILTVTEKMFAYGLARRIEAHDRPVIHGISKKMVDNNGTYRDLIKSIVTSLSFTHTFIK
ncbi:MAG: DUF1588 domain-containing protein [Lentisphaeraceae bacterium]|nr:DUF1588 domain-containing protein [Lentisphaeraceae bacterium]